MGIKYWEYEDAPLKEKLKSPSVREVAKIYFENETKAYRFAKALLAVKRKGELRLKDCSKELPVATWKRYLDFGVSVGILKHEGMRYSFTDRYSKPLRNIATYIKSWIDEEKIEENPDLLFTGVRRKKTEITSKPGSSDISINRQYINVAESSAQGEDDGEDGAAPATNVAA